MDEDTRSLLTEGELTVLKLVAEGKHSSEIARLLGISTKTVEAHHPSLMRKLRLTSAAELVRYAIRSNLVSA